MTAVEPTFFATPQEFRSWLERYHASARDLLVGFHKKGSGRPSMTWPESVDQAICFGWIDGVRRSLNEHSYTIRFSPRTSRSTWSLVNVRKAEQLIASGEMHPSGLRAFEGRTAANTGRYSFEQTEVALSPEDEARIAKNTVAWENWAKFPAGYRRTATWWVVSAKQAATRTRRLQHLIEASAEGQRIEPMRRKPGTG